MKEGQTCVHSPILPNVHAWHAAALQHHAAPPDSRDHLLPIMARRAGAHQTAPTAGARRRVLVALIASAAAVGAAFAQPAPCKAGFYALPIVSGCTPCPSSTPYSPASSSSLAAWWVVFFGNAHRDTLAPCPLSPSSHATYRVISLLPLAHAWALPLSSHASILPGSTTCATGCEGGLHGKSPCGDATWSLW